MHSYICYILTFADTHTYICIYIYIQRQIHIHTHLYPFLTYMHTCRHTYIVTRTNLYIYISIYVYICMCACACTKWHTHTCMCFPSPSHCYSREGECLLSLREAHLQPDRTKLACLRRQGWLQSWHTPLSMKKLSQSRKPSETEFTTGTTSAWYWDLWGAILVAQMAMAALHRYATAI